MSRKKEMLRDYERKLLDKLNELGLVHRTEHKQWRQPATKKKWNKELGKVEVVTVSIPNPQRIKTDKGEIMIIAETNVSIYHKNEGITGRRLEMEVPVGIGFSLCSERDQFDRQIGRVKALDRAINSYLNSESNNIQK